MRCPDRPQRPFSSRPAQTRAAVGVQLGWAVFGAVVLAAAALYIWGAPSAPDINGQIARAAAVRSAGSLGWWTGWFGGTTLPAYSLLGPAVMGQVGVRATGLLALLASAAAAPLITAGTRRPRTAAAALCVSASVDVFAGRITFALGLAVALWAVVALRRRRRGWLLVLTVATFLIAPLAALFLGIVAGSVLVADPRRRGLALWCALTLIGLAAISATLFPQTGVMPFRARALVPPLAGCLLVVLVRPPKIVLVSVLLTSGASLFFLIVPLSVGSNIARLPWLAATPVIIACGRLPIRGTVALLAAGAAIWPASDIAEQVQWTPHRSMTAAYYAPLKDEIEREIAHTPGELGERVEIVDTTDHGAAAAIADSLPLARGWDRQADYTDNPIFYRRGALTPAGYRAWLDQLAVGWVAVPNQPLDYASKGEAGLIGTHLAYLQRVWTNGDWTLYRVQAAVPLATGAAVRSVLPGQVVLSTTGPAVVTLRTRWSAYLTATDMDAPTSLDAGVPAAGSCLSDDDGWVRVQVPRAETFAVSAHFRLSARFSGPARACGSFVGTGR